ncbi:hypothetical protein [Polyangium sp. 15x6]|uniref:hypothetical protein n=1 Tax=Polyangium sp. 15x6 TaxID=3042687 RepID=UPI00249C8A03|nr:hypothetical protein [Polyangium sp. 15x6]MDI3282006.1 hypothetical protein [Polyangium sp. 15x6]
MNTTRGRVRGTRVATETDEPFIVCTRAPEVVVAKRSSRRRGPDQKDHVEQWLARIFERALSGSIVTGLLAQGCAVGPAQALGEPDGAEATAEAEDAQEDDRVSCTPDSVRETFGALVGAYQARRAADVEIAAAMRHIAADEARHAALSWKVHAWAMERLGPDEQARIQRAQAEALAGLAAGTARVQAPAVTRAAGLPGPAEMACLLDAFWRGIMAEA